MGKRAPDSVQELYQRLGEVINQHEGSLDPADVVDVVCHVLASVVVSSAAAPMGEVLPLVFRRVSEIVATADGPGASSEAVH